jgi:precorrin isomerase
VLLSTHGQAARRSTRTRRRGSVLVDDPSGRVFVTPAAPTALAQSCEVLAERGAAVKTFTKNAFDAPLTADALNR